MTRKDHVLLAEAIKEARDGIRTKEPDESHADMLDGAALAAEHVADALARDNRAFDRERFLRAAGVQSCRL